MSVLEAAPPPTRPPPPRASLQGKNKGYSVDLESIDFNDDSQPSVRKRSMTLESRPSKPRLSSTTAAADQTTSNKKELRAINSRTSLGGKHMNNPHVIDSRNPNAAAPTKPHRPPPPQVPAAPTTTAGGKITPPPREGTTAVGSDGPPPVLRRELSSESSTHSLKRLSSTSSRGSREMSPLPLLIEGITTDVITSPSRIITPPPIAPKRQRSISTPPPSSPPPILTPPISPSISSPSTSSLPPISFSVPPTSSASAQTPFPPSPNSTSPPPNSNINPPRPGSLTRTSVSSPPSSPVNTSPDNVQIWSPTPTTADEKNQGDNSTPVIPPRPYRPPRPFAPPSNTPNKTSGERRGSAPSSSHNRVNIKVPKKSNTVRDGSSGVTRPKSTKQGHKTSHDRGDPNKQGRRTSPKTSHDRGDPNKGKPPGMSPLHKQVIIKSVDSDISMPASPTLVVTPVEDVVFKTPTIGDTDDQSEVWAVPDQSLSVVPGPLGVSSEKDFDPTDKRKKRVSFSEDPDKEHDDSGEEQGDKMSSLPPQPSPPKTRRGWRIANSVRNISNSFRISRKKKSDAVENPSESTVAYPDPLPDSGCIHPIVVQCVAYLNRECVLEEQGLFRIPGDLATIRKLRQSFMQGNEVDLMEVLDPHTVVGLLKLHFRETKASIIPRGAPLNDIMTHVGNRNVEGVKEQFMNLDESCLATLSIVIEVMAKISSHSDKNFMTSGILATSSGPSIFPYLPPSNANQIIKFLIDNSNEIFPLDPLDNNI